MNDFEYYQTLADKNKKLNDKLQAGTARVPASSKKVKEILCQTFPKSNLQPFDVVS